MGKFIDTMKDSFSGAIGGGIAGKILGLFGESRKSQERRQLEQQQKLMDMQGKWNKQLMNESYGLQKDMYHYQYEKNTPEAMRKRYEEAGMNPALAYSQGTIGGVGGGSGGASVGGASASDAASMQNAETNKQGMALQMGMMKSQIAVNESIANKNNKEAGVKEGELKTIEQQRDILTDNLKMINNGMFIEQMEKRFNQEHKHGDKDFKGINKENELTGYVHTILTDSAYGQQVTNELLKVQAETGNIEAQQLLTNKKAEGYFRELLIAQQNADQDGIKAAAMKLATEWGTGEFKNWKTWLDVGETSGKLLIEAFKAGMNSKGKGQ